MASITEPPVIPNLSLPVPSRLNPEPFSMLMDRTLSEIPVTVDGINMTVTWVYDTTQVVHGFAQAAAQSVVDAAEQFALAQGEAQHAKESEVNAKASEVAAKKHLDDTRELVQNFDPTGVLPDDATVDAPLVVATVQGGVRFSDRTLNEGDDPAGYFGTGANQAPRNSELGAAAHMDIKPLYDALFNAPVTVSGAYQCTPGDTVRIDTRESSVVVTLPEHPQVNDRIQFADAFGTWHTNNPSIERNGQKIMGLAQDLLIDMKGQNFMLAYAGSDDGWVLV